MVPRNGVTVGSPEDFRGYIEQKTGKQFESTKNLLNMNLKDLMALIRAEIAQRKKK